MRDLPQNLIVEVQKHTGFPWWNGQAYAEYRGYPGKIRTLEQEIGSAVDDLYEVIEWLRKDKAFKQSDRIRTIAGRLARVLPEYENGELIREIAKGWK